EQSPLRTVTQDRASGCVCASLFLVGQPTPIRPGTSPAASSTQDHWLPVSVVSWPTPRKSGSSPMQGVVGSESACLEYGSGKVVGEVAEGEGGAAQVRQAAVDRFGWTVAGAGPVEVGQYVSGSLAQDPAELGDLDQRPGDAGAERLDQLDHQLAA